MREKIFVWNNPVPINLYFFVILGVIIFGSDQEVAGLMRAVKHMNATGKFNWIGSDGWSARALVSDGKCAIISMYLRSKVFL